MKRITFIILVIGLAILSACASDTETTSQGKTSSTNKENEEQEQPSEGEKPDEDKLTEEDAGEEVVEDDPPVEAQYTISENWSLIPLEEGINEDIVLLTIDDAPDENAVEMASTLKELDAGAIFFVNGHFIDTPEEEEMLKEIHEMGFMIGNHTFSHATLPEISEEEQKEEIISLSDRIEEIIGERPLFFRAPHGANTDYAIKVAEEEGMTVMNWTYGYDYFQPYMDAEKLAEAMISGEGPEVDVPYSLLKPGANLLMHDREWTAEALPRIVEGLREKGYEMLDPALIETK
ncbi:polysaccharide deacetylase family protein [Oceanobacillus polygoni]|uniref:Peptidoglycan/xylan/chitin deacetylase (PgdA/CDA1 family) n=1 Tax=Oceanobacillus polygoni TaxID=1235259 RepID=A0A9X1CFU5_9BACI|nr:polysaccharide deacetylase family protein [Oceanobacillus polygoni]MBP2077905.1 peptidoglycan/xylan/chitin deacetylase (PgdA/CDA1 family) [Oceanobacillus polygoni]